MSVTIMLRVASDTSMIAEEERRGRMIPANVSGFAFFT